LSGISAEPRNRRGIGGWLLLPAAGLVATVGIGLYGISDILTAPGALPVALSTGPSLSIAFTGTVLFWIVLPAVALVLLAPRHRLFPAAFIVANVGLAAFGLVEPFTFAIDYGLSVESLLYATIEAVWFLGWSWYMLASARVKTTFVN
jgi:hypothetical protein